MKDGKVPEDKTAATGQNGWKGNQNGGGNAGKKKAGLLCNKCNAIGHYANDCNTAAKLTCTKCSKKGHRDQWSGYCPWNSTNFMVPTEQRIAENTNIKPPTQEVATIPRAAGNPQSAYKAARADLDRALATMGQFDTQQDLPAYPYTLDASSWNESQKNQFLQGKDQIRSAKWGQVAAANGHDTFGGQSSTRASFWIGETEQGEEESAQEKWRKHTQLWEERVYADKEVEKGRERERKKGYTNPPETKTLRPQWINKGEFKSSQRDMLVDDIFAAMESGEMEEEEGERKLNKIYEERGESNTTSENMNVNKEINIPEVEDIGEDLEEEYGP